MSIKSKPRLITILFCLALCGNAIAAKLSPEGLDIVLLVDDSQSMGLKSSTAFGGPFSDPNEFRYDATNIIVRALHTALVKAYNNGQQEIDIRYNLIAFGSKPSRISNWKTVHHQDKNLTYPRMEPKNRGYTDFEKVLGLAVKQFSSNNYGEMANKQQRQQIIILITDGEPSIRSNANLLYKDHAYWRKMQKHLEKIRSNTDKFRMFVVALEADNDYWPKVEDNWRKLGVEPVVVSTLGLGNKELRKILEENVTNKLLPVTTLGPDQYGRFNVPCFQSVAAVQVAFYDGVRPIELIGPDNTVIQPAAQPNYNSTNTFMHFDINSPLPGEWQIKDYADSDYDLSYSVIPFAVNYIYPSANGEILPTANTIKLQFEKAQGDEFSKSEIKTCNLGAELSYQYSATDVPKNIEIQREPFDAAYPSIVSLQSVTPFTPDPLQPDYYFTFKITSKGEVIFTSTHRFPLSDKQALSIDLDQKAEYTHHDKVRLQLELQLSNHQGIAVEIAKVFTDPNQALVAEVTCSKFVCRAGNPPNNQVMQHSLLLKDPHTLALELNLTKTGSNYFASLFDLVTNQTSAIDVTIKAVTSAQIANEFLFLAPAN